MKPTKLAVRKIIELVMRCGSIDSRFDDGSSMSRGSAAHRKLQQAAGGGYKKEVSLKLITEIDSTPVQLTGRADGIITAPDGVITIDEIKSTTLPLDHIFQFHQQHLSQGKCYAYMYMKTLPTPPEEISVQLTYYQLETEETRRHTWSFTASDLEGFFSDLLHKYGTWLRLEREWKQTRNASIAATNFPFETYRKGQRELAVAVYRTIAAKKKLYASAPTGIGKTVAALFPSIKAMGEDKLEKIFYLTAKTVTRTVAEDAVRLINMRFKSITLRAKEKICPQEECICNPEHCPRANGHYDRVNDAIMDLIKNEDLITPDTTSQYANKHMVCPHEYGLDAALWCDLIIGDYNHVFDPTVYLRRFFADESGEYVFLVDEAHNLADRVRDMYSAVLRRGAFSQVLNALRGRDMHTSMLRKSMKNICAYLKDYRENMTGYNFVEKELNTKLLDLISDFTHTASQWLMEHKSADNPDILNLYFEAMHYEMIAELYDHHYTTISETRGNDLVITLFCLDPSDVIAQGLGRGKASILFSATLAPLTYYRDILGGTPEDFAVSLPSPFDPARLLTVTHSGISTKYNDRDASYEPITKAIYTVVGHKKGNYLVFFPSYEYMHRVHELFIANYPTTQTLLQENDMTEDERADFLAEFDHDNPETLVGFAVLGGIFSEGIDLKGDRLIGSIIVSVGLPKLALRHDLIRDYFDQKSGNGYNYAYVFPGMNKVLQAAGRVIRTETDSGIVLLIDSRFPSAKYRDLFPRHWSNMINVRNHRQLADILSQ